MSAEQHCFDRRGIPIKRGDIVKVFHFTGARRKRHYMFKQCLGVSRYPSSPEGWSGVFFSHLNFREIGDRDNGPYHETPGAFLSDYEIVQSIKCDHEDRDRHPQAEQGAK
ncbi:hypothetical protein [Brevundimonas diminuta]|uniref:hypothetical protein n=1 Tax=Brevundimonas diminuta TaxID=293 RepID=UPI003D5126B9